ncbi:MAG: hypothetical protein ABL903_20320 [Methylococcales bacterium]
MCQIIEEITQDNDLEDQTLFKITLTRACGRVFAPVNVPATKFFNGSWIHEFYGIKLWVATGNTIKEHLRSCIELYSKLDGDVPNRHVYRYTGWKKINTHWHYLTGESLFLIKIFVRVSPPKNRQKRRDDYMLRSPDTPGIFVFQD